MDMHVGEYHTSKSVRLSAQTLEVRVFVDDLGNNAESMIPRQK